MGKLAHHRKWSPALYGAVRRSLAGFRHETSRELERESHNRTRAGKARRSWKKKAVDLRNCGLQVKAQRCTVCNTWDCKHAQIECRCALRVCPTCARRRADDFRGRLDLAMAKPRHRTHGLYLLTFTLRYDPMDPAQLTVESLQERRERVMDGWRACWRNYLADRVKVGGKKLGGAAAALEVSPRGAVHAHVLYLGARPDVSTLRAEYQNRIDVDSPFVNVKYVKKPRKAIREIAKYVVKSTSPKKSIGGGVGDYMHPRLAARAEIAFASARLINCYGAWRGLDDESEDERPPDVCQACGVVGAFRAITLSLKEWLPIAAADWRPAFIRGGPPPSAKSRRPDA